MIEKGITPNEFTYSVAITACGNGGQWSKALELLDQMRAMGVKINTITYNSAIQALAKAARTESKQQRRFDYDKNTAIESESNADSRALWCLALELLENMESEGVALDKFTYSSAINVCGAAGRWKEAVDLVKAMKKDGNKDIKPNQVTYTSAIGEHNNICHFLFHSNLTQYLDGMNTLIKLPVARRDNGTQPTLFLTK